LVPTDEQLAAVLDSRLDLALLPGLGQLDVRAPLAARVVSREPLGIAVPSAHPLARKRDLAAKELSALPLVFMSRDSAPQIYDSVLGALRGAGLNPRSLLESSSPESSLAIVAAGLAVSVKAKSEVDTARNAGDGVEWRRLPNFDLELSIVAAWDTRRMTPALQLLIDLLGDKPLLSHEKEAVLDRAEAARSTREVTDTGGRDED
jgi:DNA-binding transcriptional LysR family regulator